MSVRKPRKHVTMIPVLLSLLAAHTASAAERYYSESVAMTGHAADASTTFDVRIARFPAQDRGSLWFYAFIDGRQYSLVDDSLRLPHEGQTAIGAANATFAISGRAQATLTGFDRHSARMRGQLRAVARLHADAHPQPGPGDIPVEIDAQFTAEHKPISVRSGRFEVMGRISGNITINGHEFALDLPGKWHEQTGVRPSFAPAFTYLFVQGEQMGLMATRHARGAWGYFFHHDQSVPVTAIQIAPYGAQMREFTATLANGETVNGTARVVREVSVPIEGKRRPGATVTVTSDQGPMVGVLNDWDP